jgi:hypothetical protein
MHARRAAPDAVRVAGEEEPGVDAENTMNDTPAQSALAAFERVRVDRLLQKRPAPSHQLASTLRTH